MPKYGTSACPNMECPNTQSVNAQQLGLFVMSQQASSIYGVPNECMPMPIYGYDDVKTMHAPKPCTLDKMCHE